MSVLCYDNPTTMDRECWQNGRLIAKYDFQLLLRDKADIPPKRFLFGGIIGRWREGQYYGDFNDMADDERDHLIKHKVKAYPIMECGTFEYEDEQ